MQDDGDDHMTGSVQEEVDQMIDVDHVTDHVTDHETDHEVDRVNLGTREVAAHQAIGIVHVIVADLVIGVYHVSEHVIGTDGVAEAAAEAELAVTVKTVKTVNQHVSVISIVIKAVPRTGSHRELKTLPRHLLS